MRVSFSLYTKNLSQHRLIDTWPYSKIRELDEFSGKALTLAATQSNTRATRQPSTCRGRICPSRGFQGWHVFGIESGQEWKA